MKRIFSCFLICVISFCCIGCSSNSTSDSKYSRAGMDPSTDANGNAIIPYYDSEVTLGNCYFYEYETEDYETSLDAIFAFDMSKLSDAQKKYFIEDAEISAKVGDDYMLTVKNIYDDNNLYSLKFNNSRKSMVDEDIYLTLTLRGGEDASGKEYSYEIFSYFVPVKLCSEEEFLAQAKLFGFSSIN